jgi:hypothetical protein
VPLQVVGDAAKPRYAARSSSRGPAAGPRRTGRRPRGRWRPGRSRRRVRTPGPRPTAVRAPRGAAGRQRAGGLSSRTFLRWLVSQNGGRRVRLQTHSADTGGRTGRGCRRQLHDDRSAAQQRAVLAETRSGRGEAVTRARAGRTTTSSSTRSPGGDEAAGSSIGARERINRAEGDGRTRQHAAANPAQASASTVRCAPQSAECTSSTCPPGATASVGPRADRTSSARPSTRRPSSAPAGAGGDVALGRHVGRVGDEQVETGGRGRGRTGRPGARPARDPVAGGPPQGPAA